MKFVDEYTLTYDKIKKGLKTAFTSNRIAPVLCGRVIQSSGLTALLDFIAEIGLEPGNALEAAVAPDGERASVKVSAEESFSALCVKTVNDQFFGAHIILFLKSLPVHSSPTQKSSIWTGHGKRKSASCTAAQAKVD